MRILGIDPGDHTGLATVDFEEDGPAVEKSSTIMAEDSLFGDYLLDIAKDSNAYIALEDFSIHGNTRVFRGNKLVVVQVIGKVKHIADELGIPVIMVRPVDRNFFDRKKLEMLGLATRYGSNHARDAVYIALYAGYFSKSGPRREFGKDAVRRMAETASR